jgi:hyperosmotically inducible protein
MKSLPVLLALAALLAGCGSSNVNQAAQQVVSQAPAFFQDGLIHATLRAKIAAVDVDAATEVGLAVHEGHVTMTGTVRSGKEREQLVHAAKETKGVTNVDDELRVDPKMQGAVDKTGDVVLTAKVEGAIAAQTGINAVRIRTSAHNGFVTLEGSAPTSAIKSTMVAAARKTSGVRNVRDDIVVKP